MDTYCTQNNGHCDTCSLVNYHRDCRNNPVVGEIKDGYCRKCWRPVIYCEHKDNYYASARARYNVCRDADTTRLDPDAMREFFG